MTENWVASLDMLAANGILNYDGAAFLHGTPPRYVGHPAFRTYPPQLPPNTQMIPPQPINDRYSPSDKPLLENPSWKKILFAFVAGGALVFGGLKLKDKKIGKWVQKQFNNLWTWIKKPFSKSQKP